MLFCIQLLSTADEVAILQIELAEMRQPLADAVNEAMETMKVIAVDTVCTITIIIYY